ncbi:hypothetical protein LG329_06830 [Virgibacillus necropolis]|uniref:hypothetical protein n=1 Tax=Virgibacillus necropolis TaxID=163877 RepID=UPI00384B0C54
MENSGLLDVILKQQNEFQKEIRVEFTTVKDDLKRHEKSLYSMEETQDQRFASMEDRFNGLDKKVDILTLQTTNAFEKLLDKLTHMDEKLDKSIVSKHEFDFILDKVHYLEKEVFKLKNDKFKLKP